jgi:hypothetical protein
MATRSAESQSVNLTPAHKKLGITLKYVHSYGMLWGNFSSLYSRFYEVTILESTNATDEGKMQVYF